MSFMHVSKQDLIEELDRLDLDLQDARRKLSELRTMIAGSSLPAERGDTVKCPDCGPLVSVYDEKTLSAHREHVHYELQPDSERSLDDVDHG